MTTTDARKQNNTGPYTMCRRANNNTSSAATHSPNCKMVYTGCLQIWQNEIPPSFPGFPYNYNVKTRCNEPPYQPFRYLSCSNAELQNILLRSMVTGSTRASQRVTQPIYARLVMGFRLRHRNIPSDFQKFPECISNFPEFSRIKKNPRVFRVFQSCKHPVSTAATTTFQLISLTNIHDSQMKPTYSRAP